MILVDSSVWIRATRSKLSDTAVHLKRLLDDDEVAITGIVMAEILQGARSEGDASDLRDRLQYLHYLETDRETWMKTGELSRQLLKAGQPTALSDLLIAQVAIDNRVPLFALDNDFKRVPGIVLYEPGT